MTIEELKQQGWEIETEYQLINDQWVARLRDNEGYLQETGKGRTEDEAICKLEDNYNKTQKFYKSYF